MASVVAAAFGSRAEADLVGAIRSSPEYVAELSLVAEGDGGIVGHVMVSHAELHDGDVRHQIFSLAPLAVAPSHQGQGIGSALVKAVTAAARKMGAAFVVLQGDPRFYRRLGFEPCAPLGIAMELPPWAPPEAAQILVLDRPETPQAISANVPAPQLQLKPPVGDGRVVLGLIDTAVQPLGNDPDSPMR